MKPLGADVIRFFEKHSYAIVSTIDAEGHIHCAAKGIVRLDPKGIVEVVDLYSGNTVRNIERSPSVSVTVIEERRFRGYTLKGRARVVKRGNVGAQVLEQWEEKVIRRISNRVIENLQKDSTASSHPEVHLPTPKHLIIIDIMEIVDLKPANIQEPTHTKVL